MVPYLMKFWLALQFAITGNVPQGLEIPKSVDDDHYEVVAATADQVQIARYVLTKMGQPGMDDPYALLSLMDLDGKSYEDIYKLLGVGPKAASKSLAYELTRFRKTVEVIREAIARKEIKQFLVLGAGNDILGLEIAKVFKEIGEKEGSVPEFRVLEVDTELGKLEKKYEFFGGYLEMDLKKNLFAAQMYLPGSEGELKKQMTDRNFDLSEPTLIIAKGLLPYLKPDANSEMQKILNDIAAPGSMLFADNMNKSAILVASVIKGLYRLGKAMQWNFLINTLTRTGFTEEMLLKWFYGPIRYGNLLTKAVRRKTFVTRKQPSEDVIASLKLAKVEQANWFDQYLIANGLFNLIYF